MLPKRYHAAAFLGILVMLLRTKLLGLHLLGIGFGGQQTSAARSQPLLAGSRANASSSQQQLSSSADALATSSQLAYRHPIAYDKLTGATSQQAGDPMGSSKRPPVGDWPIDHYSQPPTLAPPLGLAQPPPPPSPDDFFGLGLSSPHRQSPPRFPPLHQLHSHLAAAPPPPPPPMPPRDQQREPLTAGRRQLPLPLPPMAPPPPQPRGGGQELGTAGQAPSSDSLPSASAPAAHRPNQTQVGQQPQQLVQRPVLQLQQQQPVYYTPPIFAYNQPPVEQQRVDQAPYGFPLLSANNQPPLGPPEAPMSPEEFARQTRLQQQVQQADRYGRPQQQQQNLLADPQQQQRHRQQMLDRQLLFGRPQDNQTNQLAGLGLFPDPAARQPLNTNQSRPPYSMLPDGPMAEHQFGLKQPAGAQNRQLVAPSANTQPQPASSLPATRPPLASSTAQQPVCARQSGQQQVEWLQLELANSSQQLPGLFCNEDQEYPTREIMRALELYASDRSLEQLLPQTLVQLQLQRSPLLDPLQPTLVNPSATTTKQDEAQTGFPSGAYESVCRSLSYLAQPRRARNLNGHWKVVVNLPGHKYRGIAISQMVRVDECTRPNAECQGAATSAKILPAKSRCLQQYENQRLLAWSHQQGLHLDLFRLPQACVCHLRNR